MTGLEGGTQERQMGQVPNPEKSIEHAMVAITEAKREVDEAEAKGATEKERVMKEIVEEGSYDSAIATIMLAELTKLFPAATHDQALAYARSGMTRGSARAANALSNTQTVLASGMMAGTAPTAVEGLERVMNYANLAFEMPDTRAQAFASIVFSLGLLLTATALPITKPFRFRSKNREESLEVAQTLRKVFGDDAGLQGVREKIAAGDAAEVARACRAKIAEILSGPASELDSEAEPEPHVPSPTRRRAGRAASLATMSLLVAAGVATAAKSVREANDDMAAAIQKTPALVLLYKSNPKAEAAEYMKRIGVGLWPPQRGLGDIGKVAGNVATQAGRVVTGERGQPFTPDEPRNTRKR